MLRPSTRSAERAVPRRQSGLTLIELLIGMTVGVLVLGGASAVYLLTVRGAAETLHGTRLNQELRAVMEIMQLDIRRAGYWAFPEAADPAQNPFQAQLGGIQNDLHIGQVTGEATGSCLTYSYDLNTNTMVGVCESCTPVGAPFNAAPYDQSNVEMFGFRLKNSAVQLRTRLASGSEVAFDCNSGRWEAITSEDVSITGLRFILTTTTANLNPAKTPTDSCANGDLCQQLRTVDIRLTGQLAGDATVRQTLSSRVAVRNDRYAIQ